VVRRAAPIPSNSPISVRAPSGWEAGGGALLAPEDAVGIDGALADAVDGGVESTGADRDGAVAPGAGAVELAAVGPTELVAAEPAVVGAATAARTAASSNCAAVPPVATSICSWGDVAVVRGAGAGGDPADMGVGVGVRLGLLDDAAGEEAPEVARGTGEPWVGAVRAPGGAVGPPSLVRGVLGVLAATESVVEATGLVVGLVDGAAGGTVWVLAGAIGVATGLGLPLAAVSNGVGAALVATHSLGVVRAVAPGVVLGVGLDPFCAELGSTASGVLLGVTLGVGRAGGVVAPGEDGVGPGDPVARAAVAARSALATSAVICSLACWSCSFSSGDSKGPATTSTAPSVGDGERTSCRFGVMVIVKGVDVGIVAVPFTSSVCEAEFTCPCWTASGESVGIDAASRVAPTLADASASASSASGPGDASGATPGRNVGGVALAGDVCTA
jgi:hypothetical protein